jgi:monofunctional biosynthetic peptidoglycan transglycosylase
MPPQVEGSVEAFEINPPTSDAEARAEADSSPSPEMESAVELAASSTSTLPSDIPEHKDEEPQSAQGVRDDRLASTSVAREQDSSAAGSAQTEGALSGPDGDVPPDPVPAHLIWSSPEEGNADPEEDEPDGSADPAGVGRQPGTDNAGPSAELVVWQAAEPPQNAMPDPIAAAVVAAAAPARVEPQVQPALEAHRLAGYARIALRIVALLVLGYAALVLLMAVLYRWIDPPASALMIAQQLTGTTVEQRWVPIRRISPHLVQAVILSEDGAFCRHRGVDWSAMGEAIESTREGITRGGSTITMQVVKNLFLWSWRSYVRKAIEIPLAYLVELFWPKARVLEIYLNIAEWGDGVFGAEAAARHHFGKSAASLTPQEAALLAVALPSPLERQPGRPGYLVRRLASNLLSRMKTVRTTMSCVRPFAQTR